VIAAHVAPGTNRPASPGLAQAMRPHQQYPDRLRSTTPVEDAPKLLLCRDG